MLSVMAASSLGPIEGSHTNDKEVCHGLGGCCLLDQQQMNLINKWNHWEVGSIHRFKRGHLNGRMKCDVVPQLSPR